MNAFLAILAESIRLLRARKLFWISLGISALVAIIYLSVGFTSKGVTFLFGAFSMDIEMFAEGTPGAEMFYIALFSTYIVGWWLSWIALVLALISCAPIFPEFMLEGAAGVTLSKPISRVALFLYKFVGGLMFVTLQTTLFAVIVVIAIRFRLGVWMPTILWSIPIITLIFSYLFSIQTLIGVITRSVMFSILGTLLLWVIFFFIGGFHAVSYQFVEGGRNPFNMERVTDDERESWKRIDTWVERVRFVLPKTSETAAILNRSIILKNGKSLQEEQAKLNGAQADEARFIGRYSPTYIIVTSLVSELVILGFAAWIFTRRDF